jgi:beta-glucosidase/6-phospho-beta-glucosidase/beta-galactosidase
MEENNERQNIGGLFYSSLLDGFEWRHGYSRRQGLVHVKHPHLERTPNPSAWFFKDIAAHRHIRTGAIRNYCMQPETRQE